MTEAELLDAYQTTMMAQITLLTQIVALHLAMIVGIYYFLGRAGLGLKIFAFTVYTFSYATFAILAITESMIGLWLDVASAEILAVEQSAVAAFLARVHDSPLTFATSALANLMIFTLWFGTAYFLFFYKQRDGETPAAAARRDAPANDGARPPKPRRRVSAPVLPPRRRA